MNAAIIAGTATTKKSAYTDHTTSSATRRYTIGANMDTNKIIDRLKKILAIANDAAATEGERDTALKMAYNLMERHNLSMADLPEQAEEKREMADIIISVDKWGRTVAHAMADLFFCKYFFMRTGTTGKDKHVFVGRVSNTATAIAMTEYVLKSIKREAGKLYRTPTTPDGRSFCVGAAHKVRERVREMIRESSMNSQKSESTGRDIVVANVRKSEEELNAGFLDNTGMKLKSVSRADNKLRRTGYYAGQEHGAKINLNMQVGNTSPARKQIGN